MADATVEVAVDLEALKPKVLYQVEFYFGDFNLPKDKFLQEKVKEDEGWVLIDTLLTFNRLKKLTTDKEFIVACVKESKADIVEVSEDGLKLRRNPKKPLPCPPESFKQTFIDRTAYVKGFPRDTTLDQLLAYFDQYKANCVKMRRYAINKQFKGSVFVVFDTVENAQDFIKLENLKYEGIDLTKMMSKEHEEKKAREKQESAKNNEKKKEKVENDREHKDTSLFAECYEKIIKKPGALLKLSGIPEDSGLKFFEIKAVFEEAKFKVEFVEFETGDKEATIRFGEENDSIKAIETLSKDNKITVKGTELTCSTLTEAAAKEYYTRVVEAKLERFGKDKVSRKRAGHMRQSGYRGKGGNRKNRGSFRDRDNSSAPDNKKVKTDA